MMFFTILFLKFVEAEEKSCIGSITMVTLNHPTTMALMLKQFFQQMFVEATMLSVSLVVTYTMRITINFSWYLTHQDPRRI